jgi:hypothetical protein
MGNLAANTKSGDATAIALVSVSLVSILVLLGAVVFLVIKVKQLSDSIQGNSDTGGGALTKKQQMKSVV